MRRPRSQRLSLQGDEQQSYLVSVSDVMAGLIFVFVIAVVVFASQLRRTERGLNSELHEVRVAEADLNKQLEQVRVTKARLEDEKSQLEEEKDSLEKRQTDLEQQLTSLRKERDKLELLLDEVTGSEALRDLLLREIHQELVQSGFNVEVDYEHGILRLPEEVLFPSGSAVLQETGRRMLAVLGEVMVRVLPRYVEGGDLVWRSTPTDNRTSGSLVEAIMIEGHTDNRPVRPESDFSDNWDLSAARAITTYKHVVGDFPALEALRNAEGFPIFSVSGYAERRPVDSNANEETRAHNRRIDLRFLMTPPGKRPGVLQAIEKAIHEE